MVQGVVRLDNDYVPIVKINVVSPYKVCCNQEEQDEYRDRVRLYINEHHYVFEAGQMQSCELLSYDEEIQVRDAHIRNIINREVGEPPEYIEKTMYKVITDFGTEYNLDYNPFDENDED